MKLFSKKTELIISKTNNIKKLSSCSLLYSYTQTLLQAKRRYCTPTQCKGAGLISGRG